MTVLHQHCGAARSMFANRLRPIDQLPLAHCRRPQRASNAIQPLFLLALGQEMSATQRRKGISREAVIHDVLLAQQPNKRFATVEELGRLTVFLASDAAASITGIALPVDGGWTAH